MTVNADQTTGQVEGFFDQGWARIIATRPPAVQAHLAAERQLAAGLLPAYRGLVEVGCADGSLLRPSAAAAGLAYLGLDLAAGAVAATRAAGGDAVRADVVDIGALALPAPPLLVALPFNVVGNLPDPGSAFGAVAGTGADVLVLTYDTGPGAAAVRSEYYRACGLEGSLVADDLGVHFTAGAFRSSVYHPPVLAAWLRDLGWQVSAQPFGEVGVAYHGTH